MTTPIIIPDATLAPAAYVSALLDALGDHDPLDVYAATPSAIQGLCADLTDAEWLTSMAPGEWNALEVVGHLLDADIVYGFRWRLILTEDNPTYPGYNEKAWSGLARPTPAELLQGFIGLRTANAALLKSMSNDQMRRRGVHGEQGSEDFERAVRKMAGHDLAHINQLQRTIEAVRGG